MNDAFDGPELTPSDPMTKARMFQVISHCIFRPLMGEIGDETVITEGLAALDGICRKALVLDPDHPTLADLFLVPMIDYFVRAPKVPRH